MARRASGRGRTETTNDSGDVRDFEDTEDVDDVLSDEDSGHGEIRRIADTVRSTLGRWRDSSKTAPALSAAEAARVPGATVRSIKRAVDRLDGREKRFTFAAAGAAVLFGIMIYFAETDNKNFRLSKGQLTPQTVLLLGIVAGLLLLGAALLGRRAPVGFVSLLTGLFFSGSNFVVALPFLALGVWVFIHSYRIQREATSELNALRARQARSRSPATKKGEPGSAAGAKGGPRGQAQAGQKGQAQSGQKGARTRGPARPEPNKRYTPKAKRPAIPAPKPSWRERMAARSKSDG